ncbi:MAG: hypothetical protein KDA71_07460, partial [Planctomycetales bacterium]|nr:hypothetical protein [Planctomycetales bacterium]
GDAKVLEELAPLFDAAGERDRTDRILESVRRHYTAICEQHPRCAYAHNNLAWANARSHRHLDEALRHAEQAVELEPKSGSYVDTLAEVHFQRGDREQAVTHAMRAVELSPGSTELKQQLERFQNEPLPTGKPAGE